MTKRLSSKLLAVILTLAICATTVFGCLMTVSADSNSLVTFTDGSTISPTNVTDATIRLTIKLPETFPEGFVATQDGVTYGGIVSGNVALDHSSKLALTAVEVVSGTKIDDTIVSDFGDVSNDIYEDEGNVNINLGGTDDEYSFLFEVFDGTNIHYKELTFELSFKLTGADNGDKFKINATSVGVGSYLAAVCDLGTAEGIIVAGCAHALVGNGTLIETDTVNGYSVYSGSVCSLCHTTFTDPQVVPTKLPGVISVLEFYDDVDAEGNKIRVYYDSDLDNEKHDYSTQEGTEANPIIIDSALELSYLTQYIDGSKTKGMYYKVADGISGFDMSLGNIDFDGTIAENLATVDKWGNHNTTISSAFQGHFDGNGATVYGLRNRDIDTAGLFPFAAGNVTIKNVNVSLSYLKARYHAGGIVGAYICDDVTDYSTFTTVNNLTIDSCSVTDCYIETTEYGAKEYVSGKNIVVSTGAIYGGARNAAKDASGNWYNGPVNVSHCFINLDEEYFISVAETKAVQGIHGGIGGCAVSSASKFTDCVVIGIAPYSVTNKDAADNNHQHTFLKDRFSDIYTTAPITAVSGATSDNLKYQDYTGCMYQISANQIKGEAAVTNMPKLDWDVWEVDVNRGYPNFVQAQTPDLVSDASDYELKLIGTNITYNDDGGYNFNFYYRPRSAEDLGNEYEPLLYVAQLNDNAVNTDGATLGSFHRLTGTKLESAIVDGVQAGDICYTLERLSAREIYNTLLATAVFVKDGKEVLYGGTAKISIAGYAEDVVAGEAFYNDDATDNEKTADKNVAKAVLKYGKAAATALNTKNDAKAGTTLYWDGSTATEPTADDKGIYIIDTAEKLAWLASQTAVTATAGNTYKVADGIGAIILQPKSVIDTERLMSCSDYSETKAYMESVKSKVQWPAYWGTCFAGAFDGNGVEIYGLYKARDGGSLFGSVDMTASFKNFAVKNAYISSGHLLGAIFGSSQAATTNGTVCIDSVTVSGCYIVSSAQFNSDSMYTNCNAQNVGVMVGSCGASGTYKEGLSYTNCLVYGNLAENSTVPGFKYGLVGTLDPSYNSENGPVDGAYYSYTNSIILDCVPYNYLKDQNYTLLSKFFANVYTDAIDYEDTDGSTWPSIIRDGVNSYTWANYDGKIIDITDSDVKGIAAVTKLPNLDWQDKWCYGDTYPSLAKGSYNTSASSGKTIYWDGTTDSDLADGDINQTGADADHAIIIDSAEELAYLASIVLTESKYYKIADGIDKIVLQSEIYGKDIIALDSAEAVKTHFEKVIASDKTAMKRWITYSYSDASQLFIGNLDGNGVEIYGMYNTSGDINSAYGGNSAGGLFVNAKQATISNLAIKNSYVNIGVGSANFQFGLVVSYGRGTDASQSDVTVDRCIVANNYVYKNVNSNVRFTGLVCGNDDSSYFTVQNCLIYGNSATGYNTSDSKPFEMPVIGGCNLPLTPVLKNSVLLDSALLATYSDNTIYDSWRALNCKGSSQPERNSFENVYTDWEVDSITNTGWFDKEAFKEFGGEVVNASDLIGNTEKAQEIVGIFNAANGGETVWYVGNDNTYLGLSEPIDMAQAAYDAITFTSADCDNYGDSDSEFGIYATSLNLKTNPYISFAFAFNGDYKRDRENISVSFKYTVDGKKIDHIFGYTGDTPITSMSVPAYEQGKVLNQGGWENSANAGRYHIYRFEDIPVEALSSPIEVTVSYAGGLAGDAKSVTGSFSVEGFGYELVNAYKQTPCTYYETRIEAVKALLFYTQMIEARYGTTA